MNKLQWESLPPSRVAAIEELTGSVVKAEGATGGLMPGLAAVIHTGNGKYFVKAAPADSPAALLYEREIAANAALPANIPAPRMRYSSREDGWLVMVLDFLDAGDADLSPGSPDLDGVLTALAAISAARAWDAAPPVSANVTALQDKAAALLGRQSGGQPWDMYCAAIEGFDTALAGDRLVHYDLHPGNLKVTADAKVAAVDWAFACAGAPWIDAALLVPRLIEAGHTPAAAERLASRLPAWRTAPRPTRDCARRLVDHVPRVQGHPRPRGCPSVPRAGRTRRTLLGGIPDALTRAHVAPLGALFLPITSSSPLAERPRPRRAAAVPLADPRPGSCGGRGYGASRPR